VAKLTDDEVRAGLEQLPEWERQGDEIGRVYELDSFPAAMEFVETVGELAESADHHPDIDIRYRNVRIALTTHDAGGLTAQDLALAAQIDAAAEGA
jgi:4a-hydroxytetrahydrobiopterin dehydratase